ncbi:FG-GAP-like repeat-containing protein [Hymenobacter monticola]|uniref:T9SS type A sorting domain-containing protein n=1 Tax=Hymenobacter monticola TaxID=1705399 RepID=A0ABY4B1T9_9BACT|nr:FG-GAP-like repeat-containing protein [Hymenobacter monticola]UOE33112.1 T9SS type A sorting domain-containing protein [Hymenobacter monticola]
MTHFYHRFGLCLILAGCFNSTIAQAQSPAVVSSGLGPARNAVAAPRTAPVVIPFSQPINPATALNIKVFSSQYQGQRTTTASTSGSTVTLAPTAPAGQSAAFKPGETVTVSVPAALLSAAGAGAVPHVYQFTAAATGGSGRYSAGTRVATRASSYSNELRVADFNGDGYVDIATNSGGPSAFNTTNLLYVGLASGTGSYSVATIQVALGPISLDVGDVDGDGDLDIVTVCSGDNAQPGNTLHVCLNGGNGVFSTIRTVPVGMKPLQVRLGDFDGDGDLDLVSYGDMVLEVLTNSGQGVFSGNAVVASFPAGAWPNSNARVEVADMDQDGDLDIVGPSRCYWNNGQGQFTPASGTVDMGTIGDVNGDGRLDMIATRGGVNQFTSTVQLNAGNGTFVAGQVLPSTSNLVLSSALGDVDGDGDLDFLAPNTTTALALDVWLNDGNGRFTALPTLTTGAQPMNMILADADNDGDLDVFSANYFGAGVSILLNVATLATSPLQAQSLLSLSPNPAAGLVHVSLSVPVSTREVQATVLNALGQTMLTVSLPVQKGEVSGSLSTAGLSSGVYTVRLRDGSTVVSKRLMVR